MDKIPMFLLKKPCGNCPFLKDGAIDLAPGRFDGIKAELLHDDTKIFQCHKTVHSAKGGEWDDDGNYHASGQESHCVGALIYLEKVGRPNVAMRLGRAMGLYDDTALLSLYEQIIDP